MVSEANIVILAITAGIAGGIWTPVLAWLGSNEPFNLKKFVQALITCIGSGLALAVASLYSPPSDGIISLTIYWFEIFFASSGIDYARNKIGNTTRASSEAAATTTAGAQG